MPESKTTKNIEQNKLTAIDFFCGGGGMSYGMLQAGINVIAGIDHEPKCKETYEANITGAEFIEADVFKLKPFYLKRKLNLEKNDNNLILITTVRTNNIQKRPVKS